MNPPGAISDLSVRHWPYVLAATAIVSFIIAASRATDLPAGAGPAPAERLVIQYKSGRSLSLRRVRFECIESHYSRSRLPSARGYQPHVDVEPQCN
jgi:hypothetical protein